MHVPMFDLRVLDQSLKNDLAEAFERVLNHGILFMGPEVEELESKIAEYIGVKYAVGVSSGSSALYLALKACDIGPSDEVITTPLTWIITANAIAACGANPVFADVRDDFNIDPDSIRERITSKTKAIVPMHYTGHMCDMEEITSIAKEHNLLVIEDAAQSFGAEINGRKSGSFSIVGAFSMNPMKPLNGYGDVGFTVTDNKGIYERIKMLRYAGTKSIPGTNVTADSQEVSLNHKIDNINAALLLVSLKYFPNKQKVVKKIADRYNSELSHQINYQNVSKGEIHGRFVYVIATERRNALMQHLKSKDIETKIMHEPLSYDAHAYKNMESHSTPMAEELLKKSLVIPCHDKMSKEQVDYVIESINEFFKK